MFSIGDKNNFKFLNDEKKTLGPKKWKTKYEILKTALIVYVSLENAYIF